MVHKRYIRTNLDYSRDEWHLTVCHTVCGLHTPPSGRGRLRLRCALGTLHSPGNFWIFAAYVRLYAVLQFYLVAFMRFLSTKKLYYYFRNLILWEIET